MTQLIQTHPDMLLKQQDFASTKINWDDKATNIQAIAQELNIGLDSIVFVDDNPFERDLVRRLLPEVTVLELPANPIAYPQTLLDSTYFDSLQVTQEDQRRTEHFQAEKKRQEVAAGLSFEAYLNTLEMVIEVSEVKEQGFERVSQLSQKTNQFNLNPIRYSVDDISKISSNPNSLLMQVSLSDKFGNLGLVGAAIVLKTQTEAKIETFFMSCRALGRRVEMTFLLRSITRGRTALGHPVC